MPDKPRNGQTRMCPYCGQRSVFNERVQVPGSAAAVVAKDGTAPDPVYKRGWVCENPKCSRRYDFV